jgi:DNA-binding NtrC family response regulator
MCYKSGQFMCSLHYCSEELASFVALFYYAVMNEILLRFSLLYVDNEERVLSSLKRVFYEEPYDMYCVLSGSAALELLARQWIDAALVDLKMPGMDGLALLKRMRASYPHIMVIMLTGDGGVREAVETIQSGAVDFLEKPYSPDGLRARMIQIHEIWRLKQENHRLRDAAEFTFGYEQLVGNSAPIMRLKEMVACLAPGDESVLITGETGTGKERVARAIYHLSPRRDQPFVPVD